MIFLKQAITGIDDPDVMGGIGIIAEVQQQVDMGRDGIPRLVRVLIMDYVSPLFDT